MEEFNTIVSPTTSNDSNGTDVTFMNTKDKNENLEKGIVVTGASRVPGDREEALETHEVVEINKFTEKKEWIEEKIQFLESMPPIEVFAGIDAFVKFSEEMPPGLPTRSELDGWLKEHETIEKQTEIFDAEDMSKLKKLTKAATQRNLSPEDTDLIEVTLTTLLALDKLLHLLRDRSDLLDLLGLRITWEEQRIISWKERRVLLDDLNMFLSTRARWSLETYELTMRSPTPGSSRSNPSTSSPPHPSSSSPSKRRDSAASISSDCSTTTLSPVFSRSARFKLAEALSHDAAVLSGRFTSLNRIKVKAAGKTLDNLIDASPMPVPDEILDEQDRLEDKADKELEAVGRFAMAVVMQWKRADELYNDTINDQSATRALLLELEQAMSQHPNSRLDSVFMTRAQALTKRILLKADPSSPRSSFPRPTHPLFPDQAASNDSIVETLSGELVEAVKLAQQAEAAAREYRQCVEIVRQAEALQDRMRVLLGQLSSIANMMTNGVPGSREQGDFSPPDLETEACLDPSRHVAFLARLPSLVAELTDVDRAAEDALRECNSVSRRLKTLPGIDPGFKKQLLTGMQELEAQKNATGKIKAETLARTQRLADVRNLWMVLNVIMDALEDNERTIVREMDSQRWNAGQRQSQGSSIVSDAGHSSGSASTVGPATLSSILDSLGERLHTTFQIPFKGLVSLEKPMSIHLQTSHGYISKHIDDVRGMIRVWENILSQTKAMVSVQAEAHELMIKVDDLMSNIDEANQNILDSHASNSQAPALEESGYTAQIDVLQGSVRNFVDTLPTRLPFVSREVQTAVRPPTDVPTRIATVFDRQFNRFKDAVGIILPFELPVLDDAVRDEANAIVLKASSKIRRLNESFEYLRITHLAKSTDGAIGDLTNSLETSQNALLRLQHSFSSLPTLEEPNAAGIALSEKCAAMIQECDSLAQRLQGDDQLLVHNVQNSLHTLQSAPGAQDAPAYDKLVAPRVKAVDEVLQRIKDFTVALSAFRAEILRFKSDEEARLMAEREKLEADRKAKAQREEKEAMRQQAEAKIEVKADRPQIPDEDVFGSILVPLELTKKSASSDVMAFRSRVDSLRNRLRALRIDDLAYPQAAWVSVLPTSQQASEVRATLSQLTMEALSLQEMIVDPADESELRSFQADLEASHPPAERIANIVKALDQVTACDNAFSDLLEHADSYPANPPVQTLASSHIPNVHLSSEEQLKSRMSFSKKLLEGMNYACLAVANDPRIISEQTRLQQTWTELFSVCVERLSGGRSRPESTVSSSGKSVGTSIGTSRSSFSVQQTKPSLSGNGPRRVPRESNASRSLSNTTNLVSRPGSNMSIRSFSSPSASSSLFNTTFASRQRTTSLASISSNPGSPFKPPISPANYRPRSNMKRPGSPTFSETSNRSSAHTPSRSTWARAPRQSFGEFPRSSRQSFGELSRSFSSQGSAGKRKVYVANPKSKLDVAVGQVINNFRLPVTVQVAEDGWKDQSGKYWIGDADPKLCFCRILRSQTVMVRVGGGWCELSKFLKGHFADLLAELPPSPPRYEERWISSATIREDMTSPTLTIRSPLTPEPKIRTPLSSVQVQVSTPSGTSPQSIRTASSPGDASPGLTPLQYLRRADLGLRPVSPLPTRKGRISISPNAIITPSRTSIWRP